MNIVKHYLDILLALLIMFVFSAMNLSQRQDVLIQAYLKEKARNLVENVKVHGYISIQMYEAFIKDLKGSGNYDVRLTHDKLIYEPEYVNKTFTGTVMAYTESFYLDEILEALYGEGIYYMGKDDVFSVTVRNKSLSFGMVLFKGIMGSAYQHDITQAGRIRDVVREGA